jgi:hypothetical protein
MRSMVWNEPMEVSLRKKIFLIRILIKFVKKPPYYRKYLLGKTKNPHPIGENHHNLWVKFRNIGTFYEGTLCDFFF